MKKAIIFIAIVVVAFVLVGFIAQMCQPDDGSLPSKVEKMDYQVITDSRTYYTDSYDWEGPDLILHGFWVKEGKRWRHYDRDLKLDARAYSQGGIKVEQQ